MPLASLFANGSSSVLLGLRSGATFAGALGCAGLLAHLTSAPPIFNALVASLAAAGIAYVLAAQDPFDSDYSTIGQFGGHLVSFLAAMIGLWSVVTILPAVGIFVCEPLVPWKLSIAIFGAFSMSWLSSGMRIRVPHMRTGLVIHVAFFWIAPFYGFFHAPWFLAQTLIRPCEDRLFLQAIIVVLGMAVAMVAGGRAATWMFD